MYRVGIIGTENTHAMAFARLLNLPDQESGKRLYEDVRVVGVYGPEPDGARQVWEQTGADFIAKTPGDFLGRVDAMMITSRKGSLHLGYAEPFIKAGLPLFIDKPFTSDPKEAERLIQQARERGVPLCGGSGCKYAWDVQLLKNRRKLWESEEKLLSGTVNFSADRDSEYDGFYFYAPHLTEIALTVFGSGVRGVNAFESQGGVVAVLRYDRFHATLHYTKNSTASTCVLFGKEQNLTRELDISLIYRHETEHFVHMLRTGEMPADYEELRLPVTVIAAILESLSTGREAAVSL